MKHLIFINGTMGAGKTTVSRALQKLLPGCVLLDGDWCWDMDPFVVTGETKAMVLDNICHLLQNFLRCSAYENIVFCWVMQEEATLWEIAHRLERNGWDFYRFTLLCSREELCRRLQRDVEVGVRRADVIPRSLARLPLYSSMDTVKIETDGRSPDQVAREMEAYMARGERQSSPSRRFAEKQ